MNEDKALSVVFVVLILTIGGCVSCLSHDQAIVLVEKEKTKQMHLQLQAKIDSLLINYKSINKARQK